MSVVSSAGGVRQRFSAAMQFLARNSVGIRRAALGMAYVFAALMVWKLTRPPVLRWGGAELFVPNARLTSVLLEISLLVWLLTLDWIWRALNTVRTTWTRPQQFMLLVLCVNVWAAGNCVLNYPEHLISNSRNSKLDARPELRKIRGFDSVPIEGFAARCAKQLPRDARILYHGTQEGWLFAYEVYPRRVFMLLSDWQELSSGWHKKRWLQNLWPDSLQAYWDRTVVTTEAERAEFVRAHGITHEVFYEAANPDGCRCEVIR